MFPILSLIGSKKDGDKNKDKGRPWLRGDSHIQIVPLSFTPPLLPLLPPLPSPLRFPLPLFIGIILLCRHVSSLFLRSYLFLGFTKIYFGIRRFTCAPFHKHIQTHTFTYSHEHTHSHTHTHIYKYEQYSHTHM